MLFRSVTATSGMDVLCHALEAYWNVNQQPICNILAIDSMRTVFKYLRIAYDEPNNIVAREKMSEASLLAGLAFAIPKTTSIHACSYPLTTLYNIPHGEACALTLPYFIEINYKKPTTHLNELMYALNFKSYKEMIEEIQDLKKHMNLRNDLKDFNIKTNDINKLIKSSKHPNMLNNPTDITELHLHEMYNDLCY